MGSDNLHSKRKAKSTDQRRKPNRETYDRILIVCEDSKATPNYLKAIRDYLRLSTANIEIVGEECGSDPVSVVQHAKKLQQAELNKNSEYDKVYCVIDRDQHKKFSEAIKQAKDNKIRVIISTPCFEYWLLLHFKNTSSPYFNCAEVITALKEHLPNYEKGQFFNAISYVEVLKPKEENAITSAKQRAGELLGVVNIYAENPYTNMHELIEYLCKLKAAKTH